VYAGITRAKYEVLGGEIIGGTEHPERVWLTARHAQVGTRSRTKDATSPVPRRLRTAGSAAKGYVAVRDVALRVAGAGPVLTRKPQNAIINLWQFGI